MDRRQKRKSRRAEKGRRRGGAKEGEEDEEEEGGENTHIVEAVQPFLDLQAVRAVGTFVRGVHMLQDEHLDESVELPL